VVGLKDEAATLGGVQLGQDCGLNFFKRSVGPEQDIHVAAKTNAMPKLTSQLDDVQAGLGFERIVSVHADFGKILEDLTHVSATVVNHRQVVPVAFVDKGLNARLEVLPPEGGRKEHPLPVGHVAPDDDAVQHSLCGLDLRLQEFERKGADALHETGDFVRI